MDGSVSFAGLAVWALWLLPFPRLLACLRLLVGCELVMLLRLILVPRLFPLLFLFDVEGDPMVPWRSRGGSAADSLRDVALVLLFVDCVLFRVACFDLRLLT